MSNKEVATCSVRMKNALEFYAKRDNYSAEVEENMSKIRTDEGKKARDTLKLCDLASKEIL